MSSSSTALIGDIKVFNVHAFLKSNKQLINIRITQLKLDLQGEKWWCILDLLNFPLFQCLVKKIFIRKTLHINNQSDSIMRREVNFPQPLLVRYEYHQYQELSHLAFLFVQFSNM